MREMVTGEAVYNPKLVMGAYDFNPPLSETLRCAISELLSTSDLAQEGVMRATRVMAAHFAGGGQWPPHYVRAFMRSLGGCDLFVKIAGDGSGSFGVFLSDIAEAPGDRPIVGSCEELMDLSGLPSHPILLTTNTRFPFSGKF